MIFNRFTIEIMQARWDWLQQIIAGYAQSGVALVAFREGQFYPGAVGDDLGLFYFVPILARLFQWPLQKAIALFVGGVVTVSFTLGVIGILLLFKSVWSRVLSVAIFAVLSLICLLSWDVYMALGACPMAIVPLFLYFVKNKLHQPSFLVFMGIAGVLTGYYESIRWMSGWAVFLFLVSFLLLLPALKLKPKILLLAVFIGGMIIPKIHFTWLLHQREEFLTRQKVEINVSAKHIFWHNIMVGLSFLRNRYDVPGLDQEVIDWVENIQPGVHYATEEYDAIVGSEVVKLVTHHPYFFIRTLFAKFGILLMYFLLFANVGLLALLKRSLTWREILPFLLALGLHGLMGLMVTPYHFYMLGFISFSALFGLYSFGRYVESNKGTIRPT